jgi:hypothetical protein
MLLRERFLLRGRFGLLGLSLASAVCLCAGIRVMLLVR